jgi:Carboxypeptidase regulatory-like domain
VFRFLMRPGLIRLALLFVLCEGAFAQSGFVKSGGQPIPGATVTVTRRGTTFSTVTDPDGHYTFPLLASGSWTVTIEMFGFETLQKDVDYSALKGPVNFDLELKPSLAGSAAAARAEGLQCGR